MYASLCQGPDPAVKTSVSGLAITSWCGGEAAKPLAAPNLSCPGPKNGVQFTPAEAVNNTCFPCHATVKARDFVFNRYAP